MDGRGKSSFVLYTKLYLITIFNQSLDSAYSVLIQFTLSKH
jgi:hypothetical protein